jgi:hypothetical protein
MLNPARLLVVKTVLICAQERGGVYLKETSGKFRLKAESVALHGCPCNGCNLEDAEVHRIIPELLKLLWSQWMVGVKEATTTHLRGRGTDHRGGHGWTFYSRYAGALQIFRWWLQGTQKPLKIESTK